MDDLDNGLKETEAIPQSKGPKADKTKTYLVYAAVACLGFGVASLFFIFINNAMQPKLSLKAPELPQLTEVEVVAPSNQTNQTLDASTAEDEALFPEIENKTVEVPVSFVLTGIVVSRDESYALINDKVVKKGDTVDGAVVLRIAFDEVEIKTKDSDIIKLTGPK